MRSSSMLKRVVHAATIMLSIGEYVYIVVLLAEHELLTHSEDLIMRIKLSKFVHFTVVRVLSS
jgi:hypothetical protein